MTMEENWTYDMKQKLDGHQMAPPEGLWESISNEMGLTPEPARKPTGKRRWLWAAAAAIAALVGLFTLYRNDSLPSTAPAPRIAQRPARTAEPQPQPTVVESGQSVPDQQLLAMTPQQPARKKPMPRPAISPSTHSEPGLTATDTQPETPSDETMTETPSDETRPETPSEGSQPETPPSIAARPETPTLPATRQQRSTNTGQCHLSLGVSASGGLLAANSLGSTYQPQQQGADWAEPKSDEQPTDVTDKSSGLPSVDQPSPAEQPAKPAADLSAHDADHRPPLRIGLSLQLPLTSRISLVSGVSYTYLHSEFTFPQQPSQDHSQKLHYIGVPIGVAWRFHTTDAVRLYLSGNTLLEKCVDAAAWQWSVFAAAGAELRLTPQLGLYAEPSLGYYFDDRSSLEHYYKEHRLAPAIHFGLRLSY